MITLCDKVREICPEFPGEPATAHWSMADPAAEGADDDDTLAAFERTADELEARVDQLIADLFARPKEVRPMPDDTTVNVRYLVDDVEAAVDFYTRHLGFTVLNAFPAFADVQRGNLRLLLSGPQSSAARPMADGDQPGPGGWNRIHFIVDDLERRDRPPAGRRRAVPQRGRHRPGGAQVLVVDPAGNLVELFQPAAR